MSTAPDQDTSTDASTPTRRSRITHPFYTPQLEQLRLTGEPAVAFCGYVLKRISGRSQAEIMADPQCPRCEVVMLERNWAKSMR